MFNIFPLCFCMLAFTSFPLLSFDHLDNFFYSHAIYTCMLWFDVAM